MPRPAKKFEQSKHHMKKEVHPIDGQTFGSLANIQQAIANLQAAKANILSQAAKEKWHYPVGMVLEFDIDFEKASATVIIVDEVKSAGKSNKES